MGAIEIEALRWADLWDLPIADEHIQGMWIPDDRMIILDNRLTDTERKCVLAHEVSHARHGDGGCQEDKWAERRADMEAAGMLIDPTHYAALETICDNPVWLAHELDVMPWVIHAFRERLHHNPALAIQ
ncbi:ImmA/IrrE family metallo-endopeptidase [Bifidobacterium cuniculi]|uniref:ImmA/IrrE family metallo-endopeptidase n=1 Tax=Bifidobacterium cuniculi TaxID=1688 RepID=UPI00068C2949|nr:ImmA/IrrE family metallo-endopeptidase [Bifidobacterium cuniculi]